MPTYEYKCKKCGKEFEITQRITDDPLTVCPDKNCGGEIYRKISKNIGLVFKGSGFYLTDYGNKHSSSSNGNGKAKTKEVKNKNGTSKTTTTEKTKEISQKN